MRRRDFMTALALCVLAEEWPAWAQRTVRHPRLLIAETDPFTGLSLLKARYAAGRRPSEDIEGWALSWLLTGNKTFAERAVAAVRNQNTNARAKGSRAWGGRARGA